MSGFLAVYKREVHTAFMSPLAYSVLAIFSLIAGYFFYAVLYFYGLESFDAMRAAEVLGPQKLNVGQNLYRPLINNLAVILLMIVPIITMRLFSEEKKSGSAELLFTWPLSDQQITFGKYFAALTIFLLMLFLTLPFTLFLGYFVTLPYAHIASAYFGLLLMGASFIALGLFFSSLTDNQVVAAVLSFGALLFFWIVGWTVSGESGVIADTLNYISVIDHLDTFAKGVIDSRDVIYYVSFTSLFLFLTLRSLESKSWRS